MTEVRGVQSQIGSVSVSRNVATIILLACAAIYLLIVLNGGFMRGFVNDDPLDIRNPSTAFWTALQLSVFIVPVLSLWLRSQILLIVSSAMMIAVALVGCMLVFVGGVGLLVLLLVGLWFLAASRRWTLLVELKQRKQDGAVGR